MHHISIKLVLITMTGLLAGCSNESKDRRAHELMEAYNKGVYDGQREDGGRSPKYSEDYKGPQ